tara:strand:+ start:1544 stop:2074 length:531 start_codon:yes stop_codon:yes gene_type:complete
MGNVNIAPMTPPPSPGRVLKRKLDAAVRGTYAPVKKGMPKRVYDEARDKTERAFLDQLKNQFWEDESVKVVVEDIMKEGKYNMCALFNSQGMYDQYFISMFLNRVLTPFDENSISVNDLLGLVDKGGKVPIEDYASLVGGDNAEYVSIAREVVGRYLDTVDQSQLREDVEKVLVYK